MAQATGKSRSRTRPEQPLSERVYEQMRTDILRCVLQPGEQLTEAELAERAKAWKARTTQFKSGYLWKYANEVGPARTGAVTHPGDGVEVECYADV